MICKDFEQKVEAIINEDKEFIITPRELINAAKQPEKAKYMAIVKNMEVDDKHKDLIELRKDTLEYIED